ncbi:hypothetical protein [Streptomyces sp. G-G2]|uniref:hypothetical protein n=1 Tax=Streptomyces sp. G-G2 TaxID=3046201 RepID=UPI0024BA96A7|nr:hypothetical protein [Streptomyces sp. G-G2]MDJ0381342.1 hypothetical protein [Streptomyces sp. G-G2]
MGQREAVLRLDEQWARIRSGAAHAEPGERDRLLGELISALREPARGDPECAARLGLRLGDLAARRFADGDRAGALSALEEGLRHAQQAAGHSAEYARWYARGLINQGVWLAWPLSDADRLPRHPLGAAAEEGPSPMERAAGERAVDVTRTAVDVLAGLDPHDPVNQRGLAQAKVFLGDRLAELGLAEDSVAWAVDAERDFRRLLQVSPGAEEAQEAEDALAHIGRQLELRLRFLDFESLVGLRADGLLPERLLPQAVLAARIQGVEAELIAARLRLDSDRVAETLAAVPWLAVWRFDVRGPDGLWNVQGHPWHGSAEVTNRTAEDVAAELFRGFSESPDYPGPGAHWRIRVWWQEEGDPAGARFRLMIAPETSSDAPDTPDVTPS